MDNLRVPPNPSPALYYVLGHPTTKTVLSSPGGPLQGEVLEPLRRRLFAELWVQEDAADTGVRPAVLVLLVLLLGPIREYQDGLYVALYG